MPPDAIRYYHLFNKGSYLYNYDYAKQLNDINAKAASAGAFGGGRQAMERANAAFDYQQQLRKLEMLKLGP